MNTPQSDDREAILAALVDRFLVDRSRGELAPLETYQALFPGYEELVAEEYERLPAEPECTPCEASRTSEDLEFELGPYRVLEELGRGGQGIVYLAEDTELQRKVALKVLNLGAALSKDALQRFEREAEVASRLDHPSICPVYEVGGERGLSWIAMRHVEGETLAQHIARAREEGRTRTPAEIADAVAVVERTARALHAAHEAGVIHRDIKPGNVMVTPDGEPVILDFGLARDAESGAASLTRTGEQYGTPAYMAPEQLRGDRRAVDRRADVWALGVTLFEYLTLRRPFEGPTRESTERSILNDEPSRARRLNTHVSRDVAVVIEKALEKDPARRYASAEAFADELRRVLHREPIVARAAGVGLRLRRWVLRNPLAAAFLAVLAIGLAVAIALLIEIDRRGRETEEALARTRALAIARTAGEALEDNPRLALHLALRGVGAVDPPLPECLNEVHQALAAMHERKVLPHGDAGVQSMQLSRDGKRLLTASGSNVDHAAWIWDLEGHSTEPLAHFQGSNHSRRWGEHSADFSPDERYVVTALNDRRVQLWRSSGEFVRDFLHDKPCQSAEFHPRDGRILLTGCDDGHAYLWDIDGKRPYLELGPHDGERIQAEFSPDGELILSRTRDLAHATWRMMDSASVWLWSLDGEEIARLPHDRMIWDICFSPDHQKILTTSKARKAKLWNRKGELIAELEGHGLTVVHAAFSSDDSKMIATASGDHTVRLWDFEGKLLNVLRGHRGIVTSVAFSQPTPEFPTPLLATGGEDETIRVWDLTGQQLAILRGHQEAEFISVAFIPRSFPPRLVSSSWDGTVRVWELWFPQLPVLMGHEAEISHADISRGEEWLIATVARDNRVCVWRSDGGLLYERETDHAHHVRFSPDGEKFATAGYGGVTLWETRTGRELDEVPMAGIASNVVFIPPLGNQLLIARMGPRALLWDLESGECGEHPHAAYGQNIEYSASGERILARQSAGQYWLYSHEWELQETFIGGRWENLAVFHPIDDRILTVDRSGWMILRSSRGVPIGTPLMTPGLGIASAQFSPDGKRIISSHTDGAARLWGLDGELLQTLRCHRSLQRGARFTPDGERILTWSSDGTARLSFANPQELLDFARTWDTYELTPEERGRYNDLLGLQAGEVAEVLAVDPEREAKSLSHFAWELVKPGAELDPLRSKRALEAARRAVELSATASLDRLRTHAMCQIRCGLYREAADALRSIDRRRRAAGTPSVVDLSFLAMAVYRLGERDRAAAILEEARQIAGEPLDEAEEIATGLREAAELIEGASRGR